MSDRVHSTEAIGLAVTILDEPNRIARWGDEFDDGLGDALCLLDGGNGEAMVIHGSDEELLSFALRVFLVVAKGPSLRAAATALELLEAAHANGEFEPNPMTHDTARAMGTLREALK